MSESDFTIGVVVALYNGQTHIEEALASIQSQVVKPQQLVIVDDGSSDDGKQIAQKFIESSDFEGVKVEIVTQANSGQGAARNLGVYLLETTHVAFLDQDDIWGELHLHTLKNRFSANTSTDLGWVYSDFAEIDDESRLLRRSFLADSQYQIPELNIFKMLSQDLMMLPSASLVLREAFLSVGGFDTQFRGYEDDDLFIRMFLDGFTFEFEPIANVYYRIHQDNSSGGVSFLISRRKFFIKMTEIFPHESDYRELLVHKYLAPRIIRAYITDGYSATKNRRWDSLKEVSLNLDQVTKAIQPRYGIVQRLKHRTIVSVFNSKVVSVLVVMTWGRFISKIHSLRADKQGK